MSSTVPTILTEAVGARVGMRHMLVAGCCSSATLEPPGHRSSPKPDPRPVVVAEQGVDTRCWPSTEGPHLLRSKSTLQLNGVVPPIVQADVEQHHSVLRCSAQPSQRSLDPKVACSQLLVSHPHIVW